MRVGCTNLTHVAVNLKIYSHYRASTKNTALQKVIEQSLKITQMKNQMKYNVYLQLYIGLSKICFICSSTVGVLANGGKKLAKIARSIENMTLFDALG